MTFQLSPALSGYDDRADGALLRAAARPPARVARREVGGARGGADPRRRRVGQQHVGRRAPGEGRRGHAGVHERALARLLRDDGDPDPRRARLQPPRRQGGREGRDRQPPASPSTSSRARAPSASTSATAPGPKTKLDIEIVGVVADSLYEGPREGVRRQVFIPNWGNGGATFYVRTHRRVGRRPTALMRNEVRKLDAAMPVYEMKTLEAQLDETLLTDRLIALLSAGFGLLATLLASIGLYGVMAFVVARRRKELGIRLALGAAAGRRDLAGDEGGAAAAGDRPRGRHPGGDRARAVRRRRSCTASSPTIRGLRSRRGAAGRSCRPRPA